MIHSCRYPTLYDPSSRALYNRINNNLSRMMLITLVLFLQHINVVVNDSDESSFHYKGRNDLSQILESSVRFDVYPIKNSYQATTNTNNKIKFKLDLKGIQSKNKKTSLPNKKVSNYTTNNESSSNQSSDNIIPEKVGKLKLPFANGEPLGYHQMFMQKINEFSESWRQQALREDRRTNK